MKKNSFMIFLVLMSACAPIIPSSGGGVSTPMVITAQVSTVVAGTVGTPPTAGLSPTLEVATSIPTLASSALSPTELKYKVLEKFPDFFFCDPDFYPVAHDDELSLAQEQFTTLQANPEEFQAILKHNNLSGLTTFTDEQKLLIYRDHKRLNAIYFKLVDDKYQFQIRTGSEGGQGSNITGTIDGRGSIEIQKQEQGFLTCPICLAMGTLIDTPHGAVTVENLQAGDSVWTANEAGIRVLGIILRTTRVPVPVTHQVIHVVLSDGRQLWASAGHPTTNGKMLGSLKINDLLDGAHIIKIERLHYKGTATYDLLPSGDTGFYWANGILMGSTLSKP